MVNGGWQVKLPFLVGGRPRPLATLGSPRNREVHTRKAQMPVRGPIKSRFGDPS